VDCGSGYETSKSEPCTRRFGASHDMFGVPNRGSEGTYTWLSGSSDPLLFQGGLLGSESSVQPVSAGAGLVQLT
jgi:hypothetical protein